MMDDTERMDDNGRDDGELEQLLRRYAGARLSPDQWASIRMRAAVIEHGRARAAAASRPWSWRRLLRPAAFLGLVAILAVGTGATAAFAASPGGPLYDARLWVEGTILDVTTGGTGANVDQMNSRLDEITNAVDSGNANAADAAGNAYSAEVEAAAQAAQNRADLLALRAAIARQVAHLQSLSLGNPRAQANLNQLIAKDLAALADVNARLAALPQPSPTP